MVKRIRMVKENKINFLSDFPTEASHIISRENLFALDRAAHYVCEVFGVTQEQLVSRSRVRNIVFARHAFCSLIVNVYNPYLRSMCIKTILLTIIGWRIKRDHSSVVHSVGIKCHDALMYSRDPLYISYYNEAMEKFMMSGVFEVGLKRSQLRVDEIDRIITTLSYEKNMLLDKINGEKL